MAGQNYQLLKDTYNAITDLRKEVLGRIDKVDNRVNQLEQSVSHNTFRLASIVMVVSLISTAIMSLFFNVVRDFIINMV